jgi:hypothetical protein
MKTQVPKVVLVKVNLALGCPFKLDEPGGGLEIRGAPGVDKVRRH